MAGQGSNTERTLIIIRVQAVDNQKAERFRPPYANSKRGTGFTKHGAVAPLSAVLPNRAN